MFKSIVFFLLCSSQAFAFFDWAIQKSEDLAKGVVYLDAVSELIEAATPDPEMAEATKDLSKDTRLLRAHARDLSYLSQDTRSLLEGPDWKSSRLDRNLRETTRYINRTKALASKIAVLGTQGVTAISAIETNDKLEEIRKGQAAQFALDASYQQLMMKKEIEESLKWESFIDGQRSLRRSAMSSVSKTN